MHNDPNDLLEDQLKDRLKNLESKLDASVLTLVAPILYGVDDEVRTCIEEIEPKRNKLVVILETNGGYIEVARRIAETFRHHFQHVDFLIPSHAMSAGTILAMSGDAILMDYYSVLGPIDPQVEQPGKGGLIPAYGYLAKFRRLIKKADSGKLNDAELAYLLGQFDPAELYQYEHEQKLSITLLKEWLVKYKFKDWSVTESRQLTVTAEMKAERAEQIARQLGDPRRWHSHGRGISMSILRNDVNLRIGDFGSDRDLNVAVRTYYKLLKNYMGVRGCKILTHTTNCYIPIG